MSSSGKIIPPASLLVDRRDGSRRQLQVIGHKDQHTIVLLVIKLDASVEDLLALLLQLVEEDHFISEHIAPLWNFPLLHHAIVGVSFNRVTK